jgi:transcriptional regulator
MYVPAHFREQRAEVLHGVIRRAPLATLVIATSDGLEANHVPLLLRETPEGTVLIGHVARTNPVWKVEPSGDVLAIFNGAEGYISPSAYPSKAEHGKVVPTWNYIVVHARGALRWVEDDAWIEAMLHDLTTEHERARAEPWKVSDAPASFSAGLRRAVVGLTVRISRLEGKLKLSQNRSRADREGVIADLRARGDAASLALAAAVEAALAP